ncbi:hypothetical protein [Streptomyces mangrovisoli]|uniref:DUF732 domain-containing protein n=1 Tax=Streptomyces mangrovisoli TaxID=1428628 RepID=A0A1J4NXU7_9ACTN|nr:hypothetical protein [Streptomyces mangrovisoli]OIJ66053.1 hypothetical protein WN71_020535 [Streptomyces mangrovisoli]
MRTAHPRALRRATAAGALTVLLALAGCTSGGDTKAASSAPQRVSDDQAAAVPDDEASPAPQGSSSPSKVPVLPDAQLTPATGSFTAKEKKYLHGRVPKNMDPAAVLQIGQESCQRIERTAAHDKNAAIGALIAGEIEGADDAIIHLCPKQRPLLDAAATGFPDGTRKKPKPGTYQALTDAKGCTWKALGAGGRVLGSGPGPGNGTKKVTAKVPAGTTSFVSSGCYAWLPV